MTRETHDANEPVRSVLARSFDLDGPLVRLPGGEGRTYRVGDHIYRRESNTTEAAYIAELYDSIRGHGFRIPMPIRSKGGAWVAAEGWSAWTVVDGQPATAHTIPQVIPAIQAFHRALATAPYPSYLAHRDSPFDRADKAAWADTIPEVDERFMPVIRPLLQRKRLIEHLPAQLIHGDLNEENILVAPNLPPAIIDMTPYWRPPEFALAIFAYWLGPYRGDASSLSAFANIRAFDQMLIRAGLRTILIAYEFAKRGAPVGNLEQSYREPVDIICQWVDRETA